MLIVCPNCASEYSIGSDHVGMVGRKVRCAACRTTWFAEPQPIEAAGDETDIFDTPMGSSPANAEISVFGDFPADDAPTVIVHDAPLSVEAEARRLSGGEVPPPASWGRPPSRNPKPESRVARFARAVPRTPALAIAVVALAATAVVSREAVVRLAPQTAQLYAAIGLTVNLRGLAFKDVAATLEGEGRERVLVVTGAVENTTRDARPVATLAFAVHGPDGPALYTWTNEAPRGTLSAGETAPFRTRLASPPADARRVFVAFAPREDGSPVAAPGH